MEQVTRRQWLSLIGITASGAAIAPRLAAANTDVLYGQSTLPAGIRSRMIASVNGIDIHILEAGFGPTGRPALLLLHGYPELAYSWRKVMLPLANAGYHVIAPDVRGYGRTTGGDDRYDGDLSGFFALNLVRDQLGLLNALGLREVHAVIGHDAGSPLAAWCALSRPDVFRRVTMMSAPFGGAPAIPLGPRPARSAATRDEQLAALPRPRKYYQAYYSTREANENMRHASQGLHAFLRAYYHYKSADWPGNNPHPLASDSAEAMAEMPTYYVMDLDKGMAETVAPYMPTPAQIAANRWLTDDELGVYSSEYERTGFQGGLQVYRRGRDPRLSVELQTFAGRTIDVPSMFIAGRQDWGVYQTFGTFERMQSSACTHMTGAHLVADAGHWVMQEQPEQVTRLLLAFLRV